MVCLKQLRQENVEKVWRFVRNMPVNENGLTNAYHGISADDFKQLALPAMLAYAEGKNLPEGYVPETFFFLWKDDEIIG